MDFSWPEEYLQYQKRVMEFAQEELNPAAANAAESGVFPRDLWHRCGEFGIQGLAAPSAYGGQLEAVDFPRALLAMEGLGYVCEDNGLPFGLNAQMWTVQMPILHFGTESQKEKYLLPLVKGEAVAAHALTEPSVGSDVMSMQMTATKTDGGYLLNGEKRLITLGPACDFALIFANARPQMGRWGVSAFILDKDTPGFTRHERQTKMGMRSIPIGRFTCKDCFVPSENLLGKEGGGFGVVNHSLEYDRCSILAAQLGAMKRQLEQAIDFAKTREQFGQPIGKFQSVANRIVNMKVRLETARLLLYKTAWLKQTGQNATLDAAMLKLYLGEAFVDSSLDAMRTHGGGAYLVENGVEKDLRDAVGGLLYAGTSDIQRNIIAKLLGL